VQVEDRKESQHSGILSRVPQFELHVQEALNSSCIKSTVCRSEQKEEDRV